MGEEIRPQILSKSTTRGSYLSKKKTIELGKLAKTKPEEVREFFEPDITKRIKARIERDKKVTFKIGEVVRIVPKDNTEIKHWRGCWAIITKISELNNYDLRLWNATKKAVSSHNLVSLNLTDDQCQQMNELCDRIWKIRLNFSGGIVYHNLEYFAHLKHPTLSDDEKFILHSLENYIN